MFWTICSHLQLTALLNYTQNSHLTVIFTIPYPIVLWTQVTKYTLFVIITAKPYFTIYWDLVKHDWYLVLHSLWTCPSSSPGIPKTTQGFGGGSNWDVSDRTILNFWTTPASQTTSTYESSVRFCQWKNDTEAIDSVMVTCFRIQLHPFFIMTIHWRN